MEKLGDIRAPVRGFLWGKVSRPNPAGKAHFFRQEDDRYRSLCGVEVNLLEITKTDRDKCQACSKKENKRGN